MRRTLLATVLGAAIASTPAARALEFFTLASGDLGGGYFAAASSICDQINRTHRGVVRCSPESTPGSLYNIAALRGAQVDFAIAQSDWHRLAYEGAAPFEDEGPMTNLRSVMALYPEFVTILARRAANVDVASDLIGKRVDIGHPASGRHATNSRLLDIFEIVPEDFEALYELTADQAYEELCAGRIDATILIVGHPNAGISRALAQCDAEIVPLDGPGLVAVLSENPDYSPSYIPIDTYAQLARDIPTFSVTATVLTRANVDDALVEILVGETIANLGAIQTQAPLMRGVNLADMDRTGLTAPLHPGAVAAFEAARSAPSQ